MNLFDGLQASAFSIVTHTMGYAATWTPIPGNIGTFTAQVLFKDASETARLLEIEYDPQRACIEYKLGDLPGLKVSADAKNDETIFINGIAYGVNEVRAKADGKEFEAFIQLI